METPDPPNDTTGALKTGGFGHPMTSYGASGQLSRDCQWKKTKVLWTPEVCIGRANEVWKTQGNALLGGVFSLGFEWLKVALSNP